MAEERAFPSPHRAEPDEGQIAEDEYQKRIKIPKKQAPGKKLTRGPAKGLTEKERELADLVMAGSSGKDAALKVYNTDNSLSAASIAAQVLAKPDVRTYLEGVAGEAAEIVMKHARGAKSEMVSLIAAKDVLDRTGFKTPEPAKDPNQGATYNFIFSEKTREEVAEIEARIRERLTGTPDHDEETEPAA